MVSVNHSAGKRKALGVQSNNLTKWKNIFCNVLMIDKSTIWISPRSIQIVQHRMKPCCFKEWRLEDGKKVVVTLNPLCHNRNFGVTVFRTSLCTQIVIRYYCNQYCSIIVSRSNWAQKLDNLDANLTVKMIIEDTILLKLRDSISIWETLMYNIQRQIKYYF